MEVVEFSEHEIERGHTERADREEGREKDGVPGRDPAEAQDVRTGRARVIHGGRRYAGSLKIPSTQRGVAGTIRAGRHSTRAHFWDLQIARTQPRTSRPSPVRIMCES